MPVEGRYFLPHSTRFVAARASATNERRLRLEDLAGALISETPASELRISAKLGRLARAIEFRDGGRFESSDDDGIEELRRALRLRAPGRLLSHLERSWRWIAASLVIAIALSYGFIEYGIPWIAGELANATPHSVAMLVSRQTLQFLDKAAIGPTKLSAAEQQRATNLFAKVARREPRGFQGYRLVFREGQAIGANAFALPDGTIVMTDELWKLVRNDEEVEGVFGHEMSHVNHRHGLQSVYQASLIPAAIALLTGDVSQVSQLATILPGVVVQSRYSQSFEQQADDDSAALMLAMGEKPSHLADLLQRLEAQHCGKSGCGSNWLGSHPETDARVSKLRAETPK
jgi:Zn-dependent protease with chaperone function